MAIPWWEGGLCLNFSIMGSWSYFSKPDLSQHLSNMKYLPLPQGLVLTPPPGPGTYIPHGHVDVTQTLNAYVLRVSG